MPRSYGTGSIYKRNGIYYIQYTHPETGRRVRETTGSRIEHEARKTLEERVLGKAKTPLKVSDLLDYLFDLLELRQIKSLKETRRHAQDIYKNFGHYAPEQVTTARVQAYQKRMLNDGYANATVNRRVSVLRQAFRLAWEEGHIDELPRFRMLSEHGGIRTGFLTEKDVLKIASHAKPYAADVILFAFYSGWRKSQILSLTWKDINLDQMTVTVSAERTKNRSVHRIPLVGELRKIVERRFELRNGDFVFHLRGEKIVKLNRSLKQPFIDAGYPDNFLHDLRRSAIRRLVVAGVPQDVAMKISGHRSPNVFRRYSIISEPDIANAILRAERYHRSHPGDPDDWEPAHLNDLAHLGDWEPIELP